MIQFIIPLIECFIPIWNEYLVYVFAMGFLAFVGCFVHYLVRR